jgi:hypothetical protein
VIRALVVATLLSLPAPAPAAESPLAFWDQQRRGANSQNRRVTPEYWKAAHDAGIEFIRLVPDAWQAERRDFLTTR